MFYCKNCGCEFEKPYKVFEKHNLKTAPFEAFYLCPNCKSENFYEEEITHCRCCGAKLTGEIEGYCSETCRIKCEEIRRKEIARRHKELSNPLNLMVRECREYNKAHKTEYSYGQYVALIKPKLLRNKKSKNFNLKA